MKNYQIKTQLKRMLLITFILLLCTSLTVFADDGGPDPDQAFSGDQPSKPTLPNKGPAGLVYTITLPEPVFEQDAEGFDLVNMEGFSSFGMPGEPTLPHKTYNFALPPEAKFGSLAVEVIDIQTTVYEESYNIKPAVADTSETGLVAGGYQDQEPQPFSWVNTLPPGQMRKWKYASLDINPISYDSESGKITVATELTVEFSYDLRSDRVSAALLSDTFMDQEAEGLFENYQDARSWYDMVGDLASTRPGFVVITTNAIEANSTKLAEFLDHKEANKGYTAWVITEDDYGGLTGQSPNGTAEKIRQWLITNYLGMSVDYVLLIGNPDPDYPGTADSVGDVPMKMVWPLGNSSGDESATDSFYADLTGNWNLDGDSYYGEWTGDYSGVVGGVNFFPEVHVGRIPVYSADYATLDAILEKIMDYEMGYTSWRDTVLLPMGFQSGAPDPHYDGAPLAEQMMDDYLDPAGYSHWTMYQQGGGTCAVDNSTYASSSELLGGTDVRDQWNSDYYSLVVWWGHGNSNTAAVGYGPSCWDGNLMTSSYAGNLLYDDYPSFVYLNSCTNGYPESSGNLGYALLKNGAIGTISASRDSYFNTGVGYGEFDGSTTNSGIGYEWSERLAKWDNPAGRALTWTRAFMTPEFNTRLTNYYDFNLYGDPSTSIVSKAEPRIRINEINTGVYDSVELYNYSKGSIDISGWFFRAFTDTETTYFTLPAFTLGSMDYVVLHETAGLDTATDLYFGDNIWWTYEASGAATLLDDDLVGVDFVKWDDDTHEPGIGTGWIGPNPPYPPTNSGVQLGRNPNGVDTNHGYDWCLQKPSMGSVNKGCARDNVGFYDPVTKIWRMRENAWSDSVNYLVWGPNGGGWTPVTGDWDNDGIGEVG
ncbi:MAG: lamin tail domain-containing protein, partial [Anaerolineales bacterium]